MTTSNRVRRICIFTGSRADYGLLRPVIRRLLEAHDFAPEILAAGSHSSAIHGHSFRQTREDARVPHTLLSIDTHDPSPPGVASAAGEHVGQIGRYLSKQRPDLLVVLGDRYEVLAAAASAAICSVPVAHIAGGDETRGSNDDLFRHAITKLAHLHFPTNALALRRIIQMGENPEHVFLTGSPGIDDLLGTATMTRAEVTQQLGVPNGRAYLLVTMHPETSQPGKAREQVAALCEALRVLQTRYSIVITAPNVDAEYDVIASATSQLTKESPDRIFVRGNLGTGLYANAMRHCSAVVGNSSSGLYEAPSLKVPTINIGDRQLGRLMATSVTSCEFDASRIISAVEHAVQTDCSDTINPYGQGDASEKIVSNLARFDDFSTLQPKTFLEVRTS